jgi:hypothetical protein
MSTLQDKTVDDLLDAPLSQINPDDDYVYIRVGLPSNRQSRKMSITDFRSLMFNGLSTTALDILTNVTASANELNVLQGVTTGVNGVTSARINYLAGVQPGVSASNRVLVLGSDRDVNILKVQELHLGTTPVMLEASAGELNRLHDVPNGLTKTDLGNLPRLLELFLDPSVTVSFPDFTSISNGDSFSVQVTNLRVMRGASVGIGVVNVKMVINGATAAGGIREELNDSAGSTTLVFTRGATTNATEVQISSGSNTYTLELTFRGIKLMYNGTFVGSASSNESPPPLN